ncbi:MAG: hypothetical protein J0M37_02135 [Ignavibacteria bacterium]|nr:hypothetical protein [Ignavibacteria bacterium]
MKRNYAILIYLFFFFVLQISINSQWLENENGIYYTGGSVGVGLPPAPFYKLNVSGITRSNQFDWGLGSRLTEEQGGSIELGVNNSESETPYVDFHFGLSTGVQDFNTRIINSADNKLDIISQNGSKMTFDGKTTRFGFTLPSVKLTNSILNGFTSGNSLIFQNANGTLGIDFWKFGSTNGVINFYADYEEENYTQLSIKSDNTVGWGNDESWLSAWNPTNNGPGISLNKTGTHTGATPYIDFTSGYSSESNHIDVRIKNSGTNTLDFWTDMDNSGNGGIKVVTIKPEGVFAKKLTVQASWSDFVFKKGYHLISLTELEKYIKENGHLPEIPDENYVHENGIELGEMTSKLLQKIEELSLYLIEMNKQVEQLKKENSEIKSLLINK